MSDPTASPVRAFLDATVLFQAASDAGGGSAKLWSLAGVVLVTSEYAVHEAYTNLGHPGNGLDAEACRARLDTLLAAVEVHAAETGASAGGAACPVALSDPKDAPILMGAIGASCDYLLTGDSSCFGRYFGRSIGGVTVLRPGRFLALHGVPKRLG